MFSIVDDLVEVPARRLYGGCFDRLCGASDCPRCHPGCNDPVVCRCCGETVPRHLTDRCGICDDCSADECDECGRVLPTGQLHEGLCRDCLTVGEEAKA